MSEFKYTSPYDAFDAWFGSAKSLGLPQYNAMALVTATPDAKPSARMVLLKGIVRDHGFWFFTNYESRKAQELFANPQAQLLFYWPELGRQIRIEGQVLRLPDQDSDGYWSSRPRGSRLGAIASKQSQPIESMEALRAQVAEIEKRYDGQSDIPRPSNWGGLELAAESFEFWEDQPDRLHERVTFTLSADGNWTIGRLSP